VKFIEAVTLAYRIQLSEAIPEHGLTKVVQPPESDHRCQQLNVGGEHPQALAAAFFWDAWVAEEAHNT